MKRKESVDKMKPNKDLANQLKARLFDKGTLYIIQGLVTALFHLSRDKSRIIMKPSAIKTMPWSSPWVDPSPTIK